jgi:predicted transcriptional regulator
MEIVKPLARPGGELEVAVLQAIWELGSALPRDIFERVGVPRGLVYTTVAKVLDRLHDKGLVSRKRSGRSFVYRARVEQEAVDRARLRDTLESVLGDRPRPAMAALVDAVESIDPALVDELSVLVRQRRRDRGP